jgi:hypothetical protein
VPRPAPISIPTFASPEEERTHRKQQLAVAFRTGARSAEVRAHGVSPCDAGCR